MTIDYSVDHGFAQLLELAIACWEYDCSIHAEFRAFANKVLKKWKEEEPAEFGRGTPKLPYQSPLDWMFISVVFEWHDIFIVMFVRAIIKYGPKGYRVQNKLLPEDFRGKYQVLMARFNRVLIKPSELVNETRRQKARKTYNYVRDAWISLYDLEHLHSPAMDEILAHFQHPNLNLDLRKPAPENLHERIDPDNILHEYEKVVGRSDEPIVELPVHSLPEPESAQLPPRRRGRGGTFSVLARNVIHSGLEVSKKVSEKCYTFKKSEQ